MKKLFLTLVILFTMYNAKSQGNSYADGSPNTFDMVKEVTFPPLYNKTASIYTLHDTMKFKTNNLDTFDLSLISVLMLPGNSTQIVKGNGQIGSLTSGMVTGALGYTPLSTEVDGSTTNELELPAQASQSGKFLQTNGSSVSWQTALTSEVDGSTTNEIELPFQTGNNGKYLKTNGSNATWETVSTTNPGATYFEGVASGTTYNLTGSSAKVDFGTNDPTITINSAGTYLIITNVKLDYNGLTTIGSSTSNLKVRRTNNTATDLASTNFTTPTLTLLTSTAGDCDIRTFIYTTSNSNDVLEIWGNRGTNISVGNVVVSEASITAVKIN